MHPSPHLNKQSLASHPQLGELHDTEQWLKTKKLDELSAHDMRQLKQRGFSDSQIARAVGSDMMTGEHRAAGGGKGRDASVLLWPSCCQGVQMRGDGAAAMRQLRILDRVTLHMVQPALASLRSCPCSRSSQRTQGAGRGGIHEARGHLRR